MKNSIFKKLVALSLAVLMLVGSGIGAAIAGIDLAGLVGIKASAEDPKNSVLYDAEKGLFFTVDSAATIVGTDPEQLKVSSNYVDGAYTLPTSVTDSNTNIPYNVFKVNYFAFMNSRDDITKIIISDNFRSLTLSNAAFAGMDNLKEVELNYPNVVTEGPLFELVATYNIPKQSSSSELTGEDLKNFVELILGANSGFNGAIADLTTAQKKALEEACPEYNYTYDTAKDKIYKNSGTAQNCFPLRDSYGVVQLNGSDEDMTSTVRFYFPEQVNGISSAYADREIPFTENIIKRTNINTISKEDVDTWSYTATIAEQDVDFNSIASSGGEVIGLYDESNHSLNPGNINIPIHAVESVTVENIVDGNGSQNKAPTLILHKSPVASIVLGDKVTAIPDYLFYDTDIKDANLSRIERIGKMAFVDCDGLETVNLENVKEISELAFAACDGLTEVTIPKEMRSIGGGAFYLCDNLSQVKYNADNCAVYDEITKTVQPPRHITPFNSTGVTTMVFGSNVSTIPSRIGKEVPTLNTVIFLADTANLTIESDAFNYSDSINDIEVINPEQWNQVTVGSNNDSLSFDDINIEKHEHSYEPTTYPATCAAKGYTADVCVCGEEINKRDYQDKLEHTLPDTPISSVAPSCEGQGYDLYVCEVCGEAVQKNVQATLGHDYSNMVTYPATCTEPEKTVGTCSKCQNVVTTIGAPALGHDFGEYVYNNDATATKDGTETARCSRCEAVDVRTAYGTSYASKLSAVEFNAGEEKNVEYRSKVVVTSRAANVPDGFYLGITVNNKLVATGDNEEVTYTVDEITEGTTFYTYIFDANGKIATKNPHKTDVANVNTGFFAKIVSFFKGLFGMLPTVNFG